MRRLLSWLGFGISMLALVFILREFLKQPLRLETVTLVDHWKDLLLVLGLYFLTPLLGVVFWYFLINKLEVDARFIECAEVFFISQAARYLPGNVGHLVGRVVLAKEKGFPAKMVTSSLAIETIILIVACQFTFMAFVFYDPISLSIFNWLLGMEIGQRDVLYLSILSLVLALVVNYLGWKIIRRKQLAVWKGRLVRLYVIFPVGILYSCLTFGILALGVFVVLKNVYGVSDLNFVSAMLATVVSWVSGLVTPGAPAGLGIRELVMVKFFEVDLPKSVALEVALVTRFAMMVVDAGWLMVGYLLKLLNRRGRDEHR